MRGKGFSILIFSLAVILALGSSESEAQFKSLKKEIKKATGADKKDKKKKSSKSEENKIYAETFGTGARKTGGTYAGIELSTLNDNDNLSFKSISGKCKTVTVHGRTSGGVWNTLYQGQIKELNVGQILAGKRARYTHLIISVNGAMKNTTKQRQNLK